MEELTVRDMIELEKTKEEDVLNICKEIFEIGANNLGMLELEDDRFVGCLIFSVSYYYSVHKDIRCLQIIEKFCRNKRVNTEIRIFLYWQLTYLNFIGEELNNIDLKIIYEEILEMVQKSNKVKSINKTRSQRNKNTVVFITDQFLGYNHSPTKVLLNMVKSINDKFNEIDTVYIFNSTEIPNRNTTIPCFYYKPFIAEYIKFDQNKLKSVLELAGIHRLVIGYEENSEETFLKRINKMAEQICEIDPNFIISIGGSNILADLCDKFTDVYTVGTTCDMPIAKTKYLVNTVSITSVKKSPINSHQDVIEIPYGCFDMEDKYEDSYTREEFGIPQNLFLISVVGNRLLEEVTDEFLKLCESILMTNENVGIVFIGDYDKKSIQSKMDRSAYDRIYAIGSKRNLISAVSLSDMFLNPIRIGGGYGGACAVICKIPVLSTDKGDVAAYLSKDFKVQNYSEMFELANKIIQNHDLYEDMCHKIKQIYEKYRGNTGEKLLSYIMKDLKSQ